MERGSDKHGPRVDEALEQRTGSLDQGAPVESRADEARAEETPGEDQPPVRDHSRSGPHEPKHGELS